MPANNSSDSFNHAFEVGILANKFRYAILATNSNPKNTITMPLLLSSHVRRARRPNPLLSRALFFDIILPVPNRLQEQAHVYTLGLHLNHPRVFEHAPGCCAAAWLLLQTRSQSRQYDVRSGDSEWDVDLPALNEILEHVTPLQPLLLLILQLRNWLAHNVCQEIDESSSRVHLRAVRRKREAVLRDFEQGDA